jgi:hypothetical protein
MASLLEVIGFRRKSSKKVTITIEEGLIRYVDKQGASFSDAIDVWKADMAIIAKYAGVPSENRQVTIHLPSCCNSHPPLPSYMQGSY